MEDSEEPRFRVRSTRFFLTYPQCPIQPQVLLAHIRTLTTPVLLGYCICTENAERVDTNADEQEDGGTRVTSHIHVHAYLHFEQQLQVSSSRFFDLQGYHPNIQSVRSGRAVQQYVRKGGSYISSHDLPELRPTWGTLLQANNGEEFLSLVREHYPRDYAFNRDRLRSFASAHWGRTSTPSPPRRQPVIPAGLSAFVADNIWAPLHPMRRPRSLWLWGDTRLGKTIWAQSLGGHSYFGSNFSVNAINPFGRYAIFDDINYQRIEFSFFKPFIGGQHKITVTGKYQPMITLKWGVASIFIDNDPPPFSWDHKYLRDNMDIIEVKNKLY